MHGRAPTPPARRDDDGWSHYRLPLSPDHERTDEGPQMIPFGVTRPAERKTLTTLVTVGGDREYPGHVPPEPIARHLVAQLIEVGEPVRVLTPVTDGWPSEATIVVGDIARPDDTPAAFTGIEKVFLTGAVPDTAWQAVRSATDGGVRRIVLLSSHGPEIEIEFPPDSWYWLALEVVVERSGAQWTHLRPSPTMAQSMGPGFPDDTSDLAATIRSNGMIREAEPDAVCPLTHEADLAAVVRKALLSDDHVDQVLTVNGEPLSLRDQIGLVGAALGRTIPVEALTGEQIAERYRSHGVSDEEIEAWLPDDDSEEEDAVDAVAIREGVESLTRILGRRPRSYADWLTDNLSTLGLRPS